MTVFQKLRTLFISVLIVLFSAVLQANDWPTFGGDNHRSFVTGESFSLPLQEQWQYISAHKPSPAWPGPANQDYWHKIRKLVPAMTFDRAYHVVTSGDHLYYGSSSDDKVYCIDTNTGKNVWQFFTEGPVRLAPVIHESRIYFGSDDGYVYCVNAQNGKLVWKSKAVEEDYLIPGNERIISLWPIRSGVLIRNNILYCAAGVFPNYGTYLCALDISEGEKLWQQKMEVSPNGYLLASNEDIFVPGGRTEPAVYDLKSGKYKGKIASPGGAFALIVDDDIVSGPGRRGGQIALSDSSNKSNIATFGGLRMIVDGGVAYLLSQETLSAFDRHTYISEYSKDQRLRKDKAKIEDNLKKNKTTELQSQLQQVSEKISLCQKKMRECFLWTTKVNNPYSLLKAGNYIFAGGNNIVSAFDEDNGQEIWTGDVDGQAYGMAAANGKLFVSTDTGSIHCFSSKTFDKTNLATVQQIQNLSASNKDNGNHNAAINILDQTSITKGYCLMIGIEDGQLAYHLAANSQLEIICLESDPDIITQSRKLLDEHGLYGRITVKYWDKQELPFGKQMFNLIISDNATLSSYACSPDEILRVLRPYGGTVWLNGTSNSANGFSDAVKQSWTSAAGKADFDIKFVADHCIIRRGDLKNVGNWTQLYADAAHTACSNDDIEGPLNVQWFGRPGPREIIDRHHRPMSSLFLDGRLFIPANDKVICADAYNGTLLWQIDIPQSRRIGAMKDSGQMLVDQQHLYITVNGNCHAYNVSDGTLTQTYSVSSPKDRTHDWGYVNITDKSLVGTAQNKLASFYELDFSDKPENGSNVLEGDFKEVIISDYIFALDRETGKEIWRHDKGSIMNSAIAIYNDTVFFAESRNPKIDPDADGRVRIDNFCKKDLYLVAVNVHTGVKLWEKKRDLPYQHIIYLCCADNTVLLCGTYNRNDRVYYSLDAFHVDNGESKWRTEYLALDIRGKNPSPLQGSHGEQWQHPVIVGDTIYSRPFAFDLKTGSKKDYIAFRGGHGCGGFTGSKNYLYGRGDNPRMYPLDVKNTEGIAVTTSNRPGCFLNMIPAGGLLMIPESSSGCTCGYALQTSIVFSQNTNR